MKKTMKMIIVVLALCLIAPLASATTIQDFLGDMAIHPENYYILHNRTESEMTSRIQNFANNFPPGVEIRDTFTAGKNFIVLSVIDNDFGVEYVYGSATSYVRLNVEPVGFEVVNYTEIYLTIEDGYDEYLLSLDPTEVLDRLDLDYSGDVSYYEVLYDYLDVILDYLEAYETVPIDTPFIEAANGQIIEEYVPPTCEEFSDYDYSVWYKDEYLYQGEWLEDLCMNNILYELTCIDGNVNYESWTCPRGCAGGRCIYSVFFLIYQFEKNDISLNNFDSALDAWIDV